MTDERSTEAGSTERAHHAGDGRARRAAAAAHVGAEEAGGRSAGSARRRSRQLVSRELGITAAALSGWRNSFLAAGAASLKSRPEDDRDRELRAMREKIGEITMVNELLELKIERLEGGTPFRLRRSRR